MFETPQQILENIAGRVRFLRLERRWSQQEMAHRSAINLATYQVFERTGKISLDRLFRIAITLQRAQEIEGLFKPLPIRSIEDLMPKPQRQRGKSFSKS